MTYTVIFWGCPYFTYTQLEILHTHHSAGHIKLYAKLSGPQISSANRKPANFLTKIFFRFADLQM